MKRKCAIVFFAIGMLLSAAQTEARDYEKRRGAIHSGLPTELRNCGKALQGQAVYWCFGFSVLG